MKITNVDCFPLFEVGQTVEILVVNPKWDSSCGFPRKMPSGRFCTITAIVYKKSCKFKSPYYYVLQGGKEYPESWLQEREERR